MELGRWPSVLRSRYCVVLPSFVMLVTTIARVLHQEIKWLFATIEHFILMGTVTSKRWAIGPTPTLPGAPPQVWDAARIPHIQ